MSKQEWNSPPNWPPPPAGWSPPPGWEPDPNWGPAPEGWQFWQPDMEQRKRTNARTLKVTAAIVGLLLLGSCVAAIGGTGDPPAQQAAAPASIPASQSPDPTATRPPATTAPPKPVSPAEAFRTGVTEALGDLNREGDRVSEASLTGNGYATVRLAFNDNLTDNLIRTGASKDVLDVIEEAKKVPNLTALEVVGTFPLQNELGESAEEEVVGLIYSARIVQRIQVDTIDRKAVFRVADKRAYVHPAFRRD